MRKFNGAKIRQTYHQLALIHHPDRGGNEFIWYELQFNYGILMQMAKENEHGLREKNGIATQFIKNLDEYFSNIFKARAQTDDTVRSIRTIAL